MSTVATVGRRPIHDAATIEDRFAAYANEQQHDRDRFNELNAEYEDGSITNPLVVREEVEQIRSRAEGRIQQLETELENDKLEIKMRQAVIGQRQRARNLATACRVLESQLIEPPMLTPLTEFEPLAREPDQPVVTRGGTVVGGAAAAQIRAQPEPLVFEPVSRETETTRATPLPRPAMGPLPQAQPAATAEPRYSRTWWRTRFQTATRSPSGSPARGIVLAVALVLLFILFWLLAERIDDPWEGNGHPLVVTTPRTTSPATTPSTTPTTPPAGESATDYSLVNWPPTLIHAGGIVEVRFRSVDVSRVSKIVLSVSRGSVGAIVNLTGDLQDDCSGLALQKSATADSVSGVGSYSFCYKAPDTPGPVDTTTTVYEPDGVGHKLSNNFLVRR